MTGVSPITIASLLGHSSSQVVPRYAVVLDMNRLDAMKKLEELKKSVTSREEAAEPLVDRAADDIRQ